MKRELLVSLLLAANLWAEPFGQAKITRAEGSVIRGKNGVQTGPGSKAELDFGDGTVARVGANAKFSYVPGTRETKLDNGTLLLSSPKDAGGITVRAGGIVIKAAGAIDFEVANFGGSVKVISLNGKPTVSLGESIKGLKPGGMLDAPAGATKLPKANVVDLKVLVGSSELLKMGALSSQSKIESNAAKQGVMMPINLPGGANAVQTAAQTQQIAEVERQQQQLVIQQRVAAEQAAAQQLARQQFAAQQQLAIQQQQEAAKQASIATAAQEQQRAASQQATIATGGQQGNNGNQGQGNNSNQGNKPNAPPGQNKPPGGGGRPPVVGGGPAKPGRPPQVIIPP